MKYHKWMGGTTRAMVRSAKRKIRKQIMECFEAHITPLTRSDVDEGEFEMIVRYECIQGIEKGTNLAMKIIVKEEEIAKWSEKKSE